MRAVKLEQIGNKIAADVYCYGTVVEFAFKSAGVLSQRKVEIKLKRVHAKSGRVLFEGNETGITSRAGSDAAGDLALHTVGKIAKAILPDAAADVDLKTETREALKKLLAQFP